MPQLRPYLHRQLLPQLRADCWRQTHHMADGGAEHHGRVGHRLPLPASHPLASPFASGLLYQRLPRRSPPLQLFSGQHALHRGHLLLAHQSLRGMGAAHRTVLHRFRTIPFLHRHKMAIRPPCLGYANHLHLPCPAHLLPLPLCPSPSRPFPARKRNHTTVHEHPDAHHHPF